MKKQERGRKKVGGPRDLVPIRRGKRDQKSKKEGRGGTQLLLVNSNKMNPMYGAQKNEEGANRPRGMGAIITNVQTLDDSNKGTAIKVSVLGVHGRCGSCGRLGVKKEGTGGGRGEKMQQRGVHETTFLGGGFNRLKKMTARKRKKINQWWGDQGTLEGAVRPNWGYPMKKS